MVENALYTVIGAIIGFALGIVGNAVIEGYSRFHGTLRSAASVFIEIENIIQTRDSKAEFGVRLEQALRLVYHDLRLQHQLAAVAAIKSLASELREELFAKCYDVIKPTPIPVDAPIGFLQLHGTYFQQKTLAFQMWAAFERDRYADRLAEIAFSWSALLRTFFPSAVRLTKRARANEEREVNT